MRTIKIGDRVAMSAAWLRSTNQYVGDMVHDRGTVRSLKEYGGSLTVATIEWDLGCSPPKVVAANLACVGTPRMSAS